MLEEWQDTGGGASLSKVYAYGLELISQKPGGITYYLGYDGHGSTRYLLNTSGGLVETYAYDAFGNLIAGLPTPSTAYLFCGEQFDPDLGFYYLRARYLNPQTGRFWTMDTYEGNNEDPLSLHKYLYCQGNPVDNDDPSGHDIGEMLSVMSISAGLDALPGLSITPMGAVSGGNTCGPDVTKSVQGTLDVARLTYFLASPAEKKEASSIVKRIIHGDLADFWDINKLSNLGLGYKSDEEGNSPIDFGNGSHLGTGVMGISNRAVR